MRNEARAAMKRKLGAKAIEGKDNRPQRRRCARTAHMATIWQTCAYDRVMRTAAGTRSANNPAAQPRWVPLRRRAWWWRWRQSSDHPPHKLFLKEPEPDVRPERRNQSVHDVLL